MSKSVHPIKAVGGLWGGLAYGDRFETFNYGGGQRTSADKVATDATEAKPGGLVV